jgi:SNF2 family DNA or RNA helicase
MFCTHPFLVSSDHGDPALFSTKYMRLLEILDEIILAQHKAIIFTSFTGMTDLVMNDLPGRYAIFCDFIDGRVPVSDRQTIIDRFQEFAGPAVLVLNPRAAGTGLNITAARHVIHYNLEWNPAIEDQATARAHRRGQKHPVTVHRLFHSETVEEIIDDRLHRKRHLAANAVVGTPGDAEDVEDIARALEVSPLIRKEQA